jgi:hypothetical protein
MARRTPEKPPESKVLGIDELTIAIPKLDRRIKDLESFDVKIIAERFDAKEQALKNKINQTLADIFGNSTVEYNKYEIESLDTLGFRAGEKFQLSEIQQGYKKGIGDAITKLISLKETLEERLADIKGCAPATIPVRVDNYLTRIERLLKRFHLVVRKLRDRHDDRQPLSVEDEYDVQDLLHALLLVDFDDIRPEEWTPSYAGSSSRMDFLLKNEQIVIETKKTRNGLGAKEIGEQLIIDIEKYRGHPDCKTLVCFVYDPEGRIGNPKGIENDLNRIEGDLTVKVIIAPTGL